jgi:hypothetical protein
VGEMDEYVKADLENSKHKHMSKNPIGKSLPSIVVQESQIVTTFGVENHSPDYKHAMECISGLEKRMSTIAYSLESLVVVGKNKGFQSDLDEVS